MSVQKRVYLFKGYLVRLVVLTAVRKYGLASKNEFLDVSEFAAGAVRHSTRHNLLSRVYVEIPRVYQNKQSTTYGATPPAPPPTTRTSHIPHSPQSISPQVAAGVVWSVRDKDGGAKEGVREEAGGVRGRRRRDGRQGITEGDSARDAVEAAGGARDCAVIDVSRTGHGRTGEARTGESRAESGVASVGGTGGRR